MVYKGLQEADAVENSDSFLWEFGKKTFSLASFPNGDSLFKNGW